MSFKYKSHDDLRRGGDQRATRIDLDMILVPPKQGTIRKTKLVCTLGIKTSTVEALCEMIDAGMNVARLNFSHGDHTSHGNCIKNVREACARKNAHVALCLDTKGPEIRTGVLKNHQAVDIVTGQNLKIVFDYAFEGDATTIAFSWPNMPKKVAVGGTVLVADGSLTLTITEVGPDYVMTKANNPIKLGEKKNVNLPGVDVDIETITAKDREDLKFGAEQGVDLVSASFVRCANDIAVIREALTEKGKNIMIIAKIENQQGLRNFDEILAACDGIMVARGDLGMEIPPEKVFLAQKMMIQKCNMAGKPVITATQMLESMIKNPRPTRAECTDVANAVFDGTDCVMLSGETASGDYPLQAIDMQHRICMEAERAVDYYSMYLALRDQTPRPLAVGEAVASCAVSSALDLGAAVIVVLTWTGRSARLISKYCPPVPILVVTTAPQVARQCHLSWGLVPVLDETPGKQQPQLIEDALRWATIRGMCKPDDKAIAVLGGVQSGQTDQLHVFRVPA
eukprot:CAMPEP_0196663976 /NCGR_PEP_ID=MMETSP1086-20130531/55002_1 /TAXON_ID=77921 /ORGANISM="Cyanoptyche  gloeocystis , Strain SAG4.97" /LENGTH=510 /DNA_ID=CAMNT_0042000013 /DNA_START=83 /DNA_END=1615 /DNA_ORIENTATION=-